MRLRAGWQIALGLLLVAALSGSLISEARQRPPLLTADESQWITSGYVAWTLVRRLEPPARWESAFDERQLADWGNKNPPLGKYLIGFAVARHVRRDADVNYHWAFFRPPGSPGPPNRAPPPDVLIAARTAIATGGAVALLASFLLALELLGTRLLACLAPLCLFLVPSFQFHATRVFTDAPELALLLLGSHGLLAHTRTGRTAWLIWALVCGGLACAVKFSAGVFCVATLLYLVSRSIARRELRWQLVAAIVVPMLCFVVVNPYLYDAPVAKTVQLVQDWRSSKALQKQHAAVAHTAVESLAQGFALMSLRGALAPTSAPFPRSWASEDMWQLTPPLAGLLAAASAGLWLRDRRPSPRGPPRRVLCSLAAFLLGVALEAALTDGVTWFGGLCLLGLWSLAAEINGPRAAAVRAFCCLLATSWVLSALWLPFDWSRYYLPTLGLMSCVYASGATTAARCLAWSARTGRDAPSSWQRIVSALVLLTAGLAAGFVLWSVLTPPLILPG